MKKIIILVATILGLTNNIFAFPISPRPLRRLVMESQYIIVGYVIRIYDKQTYDQRNGHRSEELALEPEIAQIVVLKNLQGQLKKDTVEIEFTSRMICPEPARYFENTYVISFFDQDKKTNKYSTHALSYGAKTLGKMEMDIYEKRISEIQQVLKIEDENTQFHETVEWLLKCAEDPVTRWEGVSELAFGSGFWFHHFCDKNAFLKKNVKEEDSRNFLSEEQKNRYKKVLFGGDGYPEFTALDLVYKDNESEVEGFLLNQLKKLKADRYWVANEFMKRFKSKNNLAERSELLKKFNELQFDKNRSQELKDIVDKFIELVEQPATNSGLCVSG